MKKVQQFQSNSSKANPFLFAKLNQNQWKESNKRTPKRNQEGRKDPFQ